MTSKPSLTNCPKAFAAVIFSGVGTDRHRQLACEDCHNPYSGGYCGGVPPLPIPNREVKPACADGTAMQCGRVGGRHFFEEPLSHSDLRAFFVCRTDPADPTDILFCLATEYTRRCLVTPSSMPRYSPVTPSIYARYMLGICPVLVRYFTEHIPDIYRTSTGQVYSL